MRLPITLTGGQVTIEDETDHGRGVFIQAGADVDVSGGYQIDRKGKVTGSSAGSVAIQGANILLDGDLRGYALANTNGKISGGTISLTSKEIHVYDHTSIAPPQSGAFYLADNRFDDTGFTQIRLNSHDDLVIEENAHISTSMVRLNNPTPALLSGAGVGSVSEVGTTASGQQDLLHLYDSTAFMAGTTSFTAVAGKSFDGKRDNATGNLIAASNSSEQITVLGGSNVSTAPGGTISLSAPVINLDGTLESDAGRVSVTAGKGDLHLTSSARILAHGYYQSDPSTTLQGLPLNYKTVGGGSVILSAANGNLILDKGSYIDISGSGVVRKLYAFTGWEDHFLPRCEPIRVAFH